jgi:pentatricopeptide repeat protein
MRKRFRSTKSCAPRDELPSTHGNLARGYAATGNFEQGHQVLQEFVRRNP